MPRHSSANAIVSGSSGPGNSPPKRGRRGQRRPNHARPDSGLTTAPKIFSFSADVCLPSSVTSRPLSSSARADKVGGRDAARQPFVRLKLVTNEPDFSGNSPLSWRSTSSLYTYDQCCYSFASSRLCVFALSPGPFFNAKTPRREDAKG